MCHSTVLPAPILDKDKRYGIIESKYIIEKKKRKILSYGKK